MPSLNSSGDRAPGGPQPRSLCPAERRGERALGANDTSTVGATGRARPARRDHRDGRRRGARSVVSRGRFIAMEGVDGSGKSTQVAMLAAALRAEGRQVLTTREPGGTTLGERLRALVLDPAVAIGPQAEALIFAAARAELVATVIEPALADGTWVISDRFVDSSLAYQGNARALGIDAVARANALAVGSCQPDVVVILDLPVADATKRGDGERDRIESEGSNLQRLVAEGYRDLVRREPTRRFPVDATGAPETVHKRVIAVVRDKTA